MFVIATDMDRTLLPNGKQPYDESMHILHDIVQHYGCPLIFVSGRNINLAKEAIKEYGTPVPQYIVGLVGTKIYKNTGREFVEDTGWETRISSITPGWSIPDFKKSLSNIKELRIQEDQHQNTFKVSYFAEDLDKIKSTIESTKAAVTKICPSATVVYSVDETHGMGLVDILPVGATKTGGLEYIRKKENYPFDSIVYCGDSGNDIQPLTYGYKAVLVRNAIDEVVQEVTQTCSANGHSKRLYLPVGTGKLNGYYVSGVIEGLIHFGLIDSKYSL